MKVKLDVAPKLAKRIGLAAIIMSTASVFVLALVSRLSSSAITTKFSYIPYAIIDIAVSDNFGNLLFDKLTTGLRLAGTINQDDQATAMAISAYGESNPKRLMFQYKLTDGSMVALSLLRPGEFGYNPIFPYDPAKTHVSFLMGYGSETTAKAIVSKKIIQLIRMATMECAMANIRCSIQAHLPGA